MSNFTRPTPYTLGILAGVTCFVLGYGVRGADVASDARIRQLWDMSASLRDISEKLPPQKIVEVEKVVYEQAPFCDVVKKEMENKAPIPLRHDGLSFCKELMYGGDGSNRRPPSARPYLERHLQVPHHRSMPGHVEGVRMLGAVPVR